MTSDEISAAVSNAGLAIYFLALVLILFPLNSHFAIYGTYTSSLIWVVMGLAAAAWRR